ncbi:MAG: phenylacetate--CoA ligase family protein [Rhodocyclaceae bacterium]|nr:MAG: phenylacetate--CoA ligase family protein [Rhodocyclaceae bacterium]
MTPDAAYRSTLRHLAWPAFPAPAAANKLALLFQLEQNQWQSPEEIVSRQFDQLRQVVSFAATTVPHYRQQLGDRVPVDRLNPQNWNEIPVLSRQLLRKVAADLKSESIPKEHGGTFPIRTSGSTGMVVEVLGTDLTKLFWQVFCLRDHLWHRRDLREKLFVIRYQRDPALKGAAGGWAPGWGPATNDVAVTGQSVDYDILLDVAHLVEKLTLYRPGYLLSHPSVIMGLARHCLEQGVTLPTLKEVRTMGESPDESLRDLCREAWNAPVVDMYTCQEAGYLALQCPEHIHYHVQAENVFLEVVDDHGQACKSGEVGRVLITSLNNFATPLIRYEIGDCAEVGEPCPCGRGLPVLKRIMGRYRNLLTLPDGTRRWPRLGYESQLQSIAPIELMQMIQTSLEEIQVRLVMARTLGDSEMRNLTTFIQGNLGYPFRLSFEYVDSIRNPANGKIEQFISLIEAVTATP